MSSWTACAYRVTKNLSSWTCFRIYQFDSTLTLISKTRTSFWNSTLSTRHAFSQDSTSSSVQLVSNWERVNIYVKNLSTYSPISLFPYYWCETSHPTCFTSFTRSKSGIALCWAQVYYLLHYRCRKFIPSHLTSSAQACSRFTSLLGSTPSH